MIPSPTLRLFRLFATLLLAAIGLQSVPAMGEASDRSPVHGSAFSSGTMEVAVLAMRRDGALQIHAAAEPRLGPPPPLAGAFALPAFGMVGTVSSAPPSRAFTAALFPSWPARPANSRPRAPPAA